MSRTRSRPLKLILATLSLVAIASWIPLIAWSTDRTWVVVVFWLTAYLAAPIAPVLAMLVPPAGVDKRLLVMAAFGSMYALTPLVGSDDNPIPAVVCFFLGSIGCVASWIVLARRYWVQNHSPVEQR